MVKVRFAPSPTGIPHVGNIRTALFDYFFAKSKGGQFILRLEDTDQTRIVEGAIDSIKESLNWLGVTWDEYVVQSERLNYYKNFATELLDKGFAREENGAIRFVIQNKDEKISWIDAVGNKEISYNSNDIEDFIILKADGFPTYHLANVVDDHLMEITHVIRGEDWIPSTPKHIMLYKAFGWDMPQFAHVPNVLGTDGKKLSKRRGAKSILDFKKEGFLPEALLNYLMLLGWSPKDNREILSKDDMIRDFAFEKVNVAPAIFDENKLLWMNGEYIRSLKIEDLTERLKLFDPTLNNELTDTELIKYAMSAQTRIKTLAEFKDLTSPFKNLEKKDSEFLKRYAEELEKVENWTSTNISNATIPFLKNENKKFPDLYLELINKKQGLPIGDVFEIIGKDNILKHLK